MVDHAGDSTNRHGIREEEPVSSFQRTSFSRNEEELFSSPPCNSGENMSLVHPIIPIVGTAFPAKRRGKKTEGPKFIDDFHQHGLDNIWQILFLLCKTEEGHGRSGGLRIDGRVFRPDVTNQDDRRRDSQENGEEFGRMVNDVTVAHSAEGEFILTGAG